MNYLILAMAAYSLVSLACISHSMANAQQDQAEVIDSSQNDTGIINVNDIPVRD